MKHNDEKLLTAICDTLMGNPSLTNAARANGLGVATLFRWLKSSNEAPDDWQITFGNFGEMPFHEAIKLASKVYRTIAHGEFENHATRGRPRKLYFGGHPVWIEDERIVSAGDANKDAAYLMMMYGQPDVFLRDPITGNRVQATETMYSDALTLAYIRANFPRYNDKRELSVNVGGGVVIANARPQAAIAPAVVHQIAEIVQEADEPELVAEDDPDADLPEMIDGERAPIEPEPVQAAPVEPAEMSPLRRDLLARLKAGPSHPRPSARVDYGIGASNTAGADPAETIKGAS